MNKRDIIMLAIGVVAGSAITAAAGYFGIYRRYIPMRDLEQRIGELENRKHQLCKEIDTISESHDKLKKSIEAQETELNERLKFYESELDSVSDALAQSQEALIHSQHASDKARTVKEEVTDDQPGDPSGRYVIKTGYPRIDGPLSVEQQKEYEEYVEDGDEDALETYLDGIMEERFDSTIDDEYPSYHIDAELHESAPWFIDTVHLDYYEADDILAEGQRMVDNVDQTINPIVLNRFGPNSLSGDPNVVWCRNDILKIDYEITRHSGSYQHEVMGIPEDVAYDPPRKFNKERAAMMEERYGSRH